MNIAIPMRGSPPARPGASTASVMLAPAARGSRREGGMAARVFVVSLLVNIAAALVIGYVWGVGNADALSRTTNAWYVLFSRDPHLAAAGFVWPVLPSMAELPFLPLLRLLGHQEFAGSLMSAASGAGTLAVLSLTLGSLGITGWTRLCWLAFVQIHPEFLYISANGMAEAPSMLFLTLALFAYLSIRTNKLAPAALGLCLAGAFFVRYEVLGTMAATALALFILSVRSEAGPRRGSLARRWLSRVDWATFEGRVLVTMVASAYAVALWLLANWMIMGDPLYFNDSTFSLASANDVAKNYGPHHPLYRDMHSIVLTAQYALLRLTQVNITLPIMAALAAWVALRKGDRRLLGLVVIAAGTFGLTALEVYQGTLPPYLRYWSLAIPFGVVIAACVHATAGGLLARVLRPGVALLLLVAAFVNVKGLGYPINGLDEIRVSAHLTNNAALERHALMFDYNAQKRHDGRLIATALDRYSARGLTMIDTETGFAGILWTAHPERLAISSDRDFGRILVNPRRTLRYILVTDPTVGEARDFTNRRYPGIFAGHVPWARYVGSVKGTILPWRVFQVMPYGHPLGPIASVDASASVGARSYYLADGHTGSPFQEAVSIRNPDARWPAHVSLRLLSVAGGAGRVVRLVVPAGARLVEDIGALLPRQVFGIVVEADRSVAVTRTIARGRSILIADGVTRAARRWDFAGAVPRAGARTYLAVLNPAGSPAHVTVTFYNRNRAGKPVGRAVIVVVARSRSTIGVHRRVRTTNVASVVASDAPIVVEQVTYSEAPGKAAYAPDTAPRQTMR
jgi:hypothetical protein